MSCQTCLTSFFLEHKRSILRNEWLQSRLQESFLCSTFTLSFSSALWTSFYWFSSLSLSPSLSLSVSLSQVLKTRTPFYSTLFHSLSLNTHMYSLSLSSPQPLSLFHSVMQQERQQCGMLFALGCKPFCSSIFQVMCVKTLSLTHIPFASGTCSHSSQICQIVELKMFIHFFTAKVLHSLGGISNLHKSLCMFLVIN